MRAWRACVKGLVFILALVLAGSAAAQDSGTPGAGTQGSATAVAVDCSTAGPYAQSVVTAFNGAGPLIDFMSDADATWGTMSDEDANAAIAAGDALLAELSSIEPPAIYAQAHEGIITVVRFNVGLVRFYTFDSSLVPDIAQMEMAWKRIDAGEYAIADACPQEVAQRGGYLVFEPSPHPGEIENLPE